MNTIFSLQNTQKVFKHLSNSCFPDIMRGRLFIRSMATHVLFSTTFPTTSCLRLLRFKFFSFTDTSRFISTAQNKYLHLMESTDCNRFYTTKARIFSDIDSLTPHKHSSALGAKIRKKVAVPRPDAESGSAEVVAYAISEEIYLENLDNFLTNQKLYKKLPLPSDVEDAIYAKAVYEVDQGCRDVFFFREGAIVFWNMSYLERKEILQQVRKFCDSPYNLALTMSENESLNFCYTDKPQTTFDNEIQFGKTSDAHVLEKYAFSNALTLSVKLALWEESLVQFVDSIEPLIDDLRCGRKIRITRENLLRKTGELFTLRHLVNLSSDLLDTPDFYWDREGLEPLYQKTINYLNITKRTRVINEKLNHCCELIELLSDHLNDQHHTRLEVMIIILIMVEVMFEIIHYIEKYYSGVDPDILIPIMDK